MNEIAQTTVDRLRELHREILGAVRMTLDKAIEAGGILEEVKAELPHGDFTQWCGGQRGLRYPNATAIHASSQKPRAVEKRQRVVFDRSIRGPGGTSSA